jgi:hypothetical protein
MNRSVLAVAQDLRWRRWLDLWTLAMAPAVLLALVALPVLVDWPPATTSSGVQA